MSEFRFPNEQELYFVNSSTDLNHNTPLATQSQTNYLVPILFIAGSISLVAILFYLINKNEEHHDLID